MASIALSQLCLRAHPARREEADVVEPRVARLHFIARALRAPHWFLIRLFRRYFETAPGWVIMTTRGRKTGLPREVLLPCERSDDAIVVISTFHWRSDWIRNIRVNPEVEVTCAGWRVSARAEIVEDPAAKRALITQHLYFPTAPFILVHAVLRTVLRPLLLAWMRSWVGPRPIVVIHRKQAGDVG
jgi:deazaflavin-dependent oxidoreductase (nitroreductase family)